MKKLYLIDYSHEGMRLDRWIRNNLGKIPQSLIEKFIRKGKIKVNNKKVKSSYNLCVKDEVNVFDFNIKDQVFDKKIKYNTSSSVIK